MVLSFQVFEGVDGYNEQHDNGGKQGQG